MTDFSGQRVHVIGLGALGTGRAVARVLAARGAQVTVSDAKPAAALAEEIASLADTGATVLTGEEAYRGLEEADLIVPSPGVPLQLPPLLRARERGVRIVAEIEVAYWLAPCPIIAITGAKGKTTTTALLGELLRDAGVAAHVGGNIGRPLIELAAAAAPGDLLVAEVSSFQLEATERFRPRVAALLNLFPDHLDRHETMEAYGAAKARIFANQEPEDAAVIGRDEPGAWALRACTKARVLPFSLAAPAPEGADLEDGWLRVAGRRICPASALRLRGRHNLGNALAALALAQAAGASLERAEETLRRFPGVEHRLEMVAMAGRVLFVNDSQATTPAATIAALEAFEEPVALIAGGRAKVHDFTELAQTAARREVILVLIGEAAAEIEAAAQAAGVKQVVRAETLPEAVQRAYRAVAPEGVVLLSPACASFDMFVNMSARGRVFKEAVREIAAGEGRG